MKLGRGATGATVLVVLAAMAWACGGDDSSSTVCPADDKSTTVDESQCKALSTVKQGQTSVTARGCPSCHGADMSGSTSILVRSTIPTTTALGESIALYPPNLTPDKTSGIGVAKWTDDALALAIRDGIDADSQRLCPQMNHFSTMNDFEVYSIVMYLRSLPAVSTKVPRSVCPPTKTKEQQ